MDTAAFATWLGGIGLLHPAQRAEAFRELALAEADDPVEASAHPVDAAVPLDEAAVAPSLPLAKADDAAPEEDLLSKVGRIGLRALAVRTAVGMTLIPGARPAESLGTAARAAGRHSIR